MCCDVEKRNVRCFPKPTLTRENPFHKPVPASPASPASWRYYLAASGSTIERKTRKFGMTDDPERLKTPKGYA